MGVDNPETAASLAVAECARGNHRWVPMGFCAFCRVVQPGVLRDVVDQVRQKLAEFEQRGELLAFSEQVRLLLQAVEGPPPGRGLPPRGPQTVAPERLADAREKEQSAHARIVRQKLLDERKVRGEKLEQLESILYEMRAGLKQIESVLGESINFAEPATWRDGQWRDVIHVSADGRVVNDEYPGEVQEYRNEATKRPFDENAMSIDYDAVCDTCKQVVHAGQISAGAHRLAYGFDDHLGVQNLARWLFTHAGEGHVVRIEPMDVSEPRPSDDYERVEL